MATRNSRAAAAAAVRVRAMGFEALPPSVVRAYFAAAACADANGVFTVRGVIETLGTAGSPCWVWKCVVRLESAGLVEAIDVSGRHRRYRIPPTRFITPEELSRERDEA